MASDEEEKKSSPFLSSHLALACHLRVTTLTIDLYISVIIWLEYYKAAFFTLAFFKIPAVEKSRNGQGKLAEIFAWESQKIGMQQMLKTATRWREEPEGKCSNTYESASVKKDIPNSNDA